MSLSKNIGKQFFEWVASLVVGKWYMILIFSLLITIWSSIFLTRISLESDIMSLLPSNDKVVQNFIEASKVFGPSQKLVALVRFAPTLPKPKTVIFMDNFSNLLKQNSDVENVDYKIPHVNFYDTKKSGGDSFDIAYSYYSTEKKTNNFLMFITLFGSSGDIKFCKRILKQIEDIEKTAIADSELNENDVTISYTGGHAVTFYESKSMEKGIKITVLTTFVTILLLFYLFFRRFKILFCVSIALIVAIAWTLAFAYFAIGSLNILTIAFAAILIGIGIDFAIHISNRFILELQNGVFLKEAIAIAITKTGVGIFYSCITTSLAFFSLSLTGFQNVEEFGLLVGTGLILCMLSMFFVLPSLFMMTIKTSKKKIQKQNTHFIYLKHFANFISIDSKIISASLLLVWALLSIAIFSRYGILKFDNSLDSMSAAHNPAIQTQKEILENFGNSIEPIMLIAKNKDPKESFVSIYNTIPIINKLTKEQYMLKTENIFKYLPSIDTYKKFLLRVKNVDIQRMLDNSIDNLKGDVKKIDEYKFLTSKRNLILKTLKAGIVSFDYFPIIFLLPDELISKFFVEDKESGFFYSVNYLYPKTRITDEMEVEALEHTLSSNQNNLFMSGMGIMVGRLETLIKRDFKFIISLIIVITILILTIIYKKISLVFISSLTLLVSVMFTVIFMLGVGIKLNYINIIAFPLIIGMGIDDSIHMLQRYFENNDRSIFTVITTTGRAILLTSLTTMLGFGSLIFTGHSGLASLGIVTSAGIGFCLLSSFFILPGLIVMATEKNII